MKITILSTLFIVCLMGHEPVVSGQFFDFFDDFDLIEWVFGSAETNILRGIDILCSYYLAVKTQETAIDATKITFQLRTACETEVFYLNDIQKMLHSEIYDIRKPLVIFVSGWLIGPQNGKIQLVEKAYHCRNDSNFVVIDTARFIKTLYVASALNTQLIGQILAEGLYKLVKEHPTLDIHLIGHSLGAQIVGSTGRNFFNLAGVKIPRITGLDPANPCFNADKTIQVITKNDATFVDIIHTNPGGFGKAEPLGTVDFYVGGLNAIQPNCFILPCSHVRAIDYYAESVYPVNEKNFLAVPCFSMVEVKFGNCSGVAIPMGYSTPLSSSGLYYLTVNSKEPYGKNAPSNAYLSTSVCNSCK